MAASTRSRLSSGSPIPMNTMFVSRWPSRHEPARRRSGPGRRSRRPPGRARTRARRSRRTGSRRRSRPGSRCTACAARAIPAAPGSASGPIRSSAPSASRWSAFSVRPPSASRSSVSATVSNRKAASSSARRAAGSVSDLVDRADDAAPHRVADLARAIAPATPRAASHARERIAGSGRTGQARGVGRSRVRPRAHVAADDPAGRPRRYVDPRHPPAARRLDLVEQRASRRAVARPSRPEPTRRLVLRRAATAPPDDEPTTRACRGTSPATAGRHGPVARARSRVASGRAGRPRAGAAW